MGKMYFTKREGGCGRFWNIGAVAFIRVQRFFSNIMRQNWPTRGL